MKLITSSKHRVNESFDNRSVWFDILNKGSWCTSTLFSYIEVELSSDHRSRDLLATTLRHHQLMLVKIHFFLTPILKTITCNYVSSVQSHSSHRELKFIPEKNIYIFKNIANTTTDFFLLCVAQLSEWHIVVQDKHRYR